MWAVRRASTPKYHHQGLVYDSCNMSVQSPFALRSGASRILLLCYMRTRRHLVPMLNDESRDILLLEQLRHVTITFQRYYHPKTAPLRIRSTLEGISAKVKDYRKELVEWINGEDI